MDKLLDDGHGLYLISHRAYPHYTEPYKITENWLDDDQFDIKEGKCKIFGYSLCDEPIDYWNNKFIDIASDDNEHEISIELMKKDGILN